MERLKNMKEILMSAVEGQIGNLNEVDAEELGEVVDMIKDFSEAIYYCTITKEMEERKKEEEYAMKERMSRPMYYQQPQPMMYDSGERRMYYSDGGSNSNNSNSNGGYNSSARGNNARGGGSRGYHEEYYPYPSEIRDFREGRSPVTRRNYMESKELHQGKEKQMKELEKYMKELTDDICEMVEDASPEEKQILVQKLNTLAGKIQ